MNFVPSMVPKKRDDDDKSTSSDGTVEEPTETEQRYAALRNHQIRFADAIDPNAERVYKLRKKDIIFGRGRGFQNHPGNERMRDIIEKYKTQYHSLNRDGKRKLVEAVHAEITEGGARFLKKLDNEQAWVVVDLPIALQKVSHTMRCRKSIIRQLDEHGNIPTTLGGAVGHATLPGVPIVIAAMPGPGAIPGMASAAGIPGLSDPTAGVLPGANPAAAGLPSMGASGLYAPPAAVGASDTSLAGLEAQRLAALHRYRVLSGMAVARQGDIEYYQHLRREQLLRETRMLQQMGDVALLGGPSPPGVAPTAATSSLVAVPNNTLGVPGAAAAGIPGATAGLQSPSAGLPGAAGAQLPASMLQANPHQLAGPALGPEATLHPPSTMTEPTE